MKKALLWIKVFFYLLPMWLTAKRCRREAFPVRFEVVKHWAKKVVNASGAKVETIGIENVPKDETVYFVSNHQGSLDPFIFVYKSPIPTTLVSKVENTKIPVISAWMKTLEVISFKRDDLRASVQMVKDVAKTLSDGRNVIIYPEGTRSKSQNIGDFKPGALKPAYMAKVSIVPVTMVNSFLIDINSKGNNHITIQFDKPIKYDEYKDLTTVELTDKIKAQIQSNIEALSTKKEDINGSV